MLTLPSLSCISLQVGCCQGVILNAAGLWACCKCLGLGSSVLHCVPLCSDQQLYKVLRFHCCHGS
jgi:hypothetical protein